MLGTIIKKELLNNLLNAKFLVCYAVVFLLTLLSVQNMGVKYNRDYEAYRKNSARFLKENRATETLGESCRYDVQIPPARLRVFSTGFDGEITTPYHVSMPLPYEYGQYNDADPVGAQYALYDLGFIVAVVMSLLTLFMSFDTLNGERRNHTFRLVFTNPVNRTTVILGKLIGGYVTLMVPFALAWVCALIMLVAVQGITFTGAEWMRMLLMAGTSGLYVAVFFMLSALFSAWCDDPGRSLLGLVTVWVALVAVLPNVSVALAKACIRIPTEGELLQSKEAMDKEETDKAVAFEKNLLKVHGPKKGWSTEVGVSNQKAFLDRWNNITKRWDGMLEEQRTHLEHRMRTGTNIARVSPAAGFMSAFSHLAGTGMDDFIDSEYWKRNLMVKTFEVEEAEWARRRAADPIRGGMEGEDHYAQLTRLRKGPIDFDLLPSREYRRAGLGTALRRVLVDVTVLALELVALFMATYLVFVRRRTV